MSEEQKKKIVTTRRKNNSYVVSKETREKNRLSHLGKKPSEETKKKMSESNKKVIHTEEWNVKISLANKGQIPWIKGKHLSDEHKRKVSKANLGRKHSEKSRKNMSIAHKGQKAWNKGKTGIYSAETRRKMSESQKGKVRYVMTEEIRRKMSYPRGEKAWNWKGGTSPEYRLIRRSIDFKLWREAVFMIDNYTCQKCGIRGGELHPHHILNFSEHPYFRFVVENGITLCKGCHELFHKIYGKKNNNHYQLYEFIPTPH